MGRLIMFVVALLAPIVAMAQNRFPKPDFESGYEYPDHEYAVPNEILWDVLDVTMLLALLLAATPESLLSKTHFSQVQAGHTLSLIHI